MEIIFWVAVLVILLGLSGWAEYATKRDAVEEGIKRARKN